MRACVRVRGAGQAQRRGGPRHGLEDTLDLRGAVREGVRPEIVTRVLDELYERDKQAPPK